MVGESAKQLIDDQSDPDMESGEAMGTEQKPQEITSKRGAKQLHDKKPKNAARVIFDQAKPNPKPINVYKEMVNSTEGKAGFYAWWTIDGVSAPQGRQEIVKINPRTEEERTVGYEFTIPYTAEIKKKLLADIGPKTHFYHKDGESTITVRPEDW